MMEGGIGGLKRGSESMKSSTKIGGIYGITAGQHHLFRDSGHEDK